MFSKLVNLPSPKLAVCLAVLPLALPVTYLIYLDRAVSKQLKTATGFRNKRTRISTIPAEVSRPTTLPEEVRADESEWILAYERITSKPLPQSSLPDNVSAVVTDYVRATMTAFSWTPQAFLLRAAAGDEAVRKTFDTPYIRNLGFCNGERVNGFWSVVHRGNGGLQGHERVEMALDAPPTYKGARVNGVIVAGVEVQSDGGVVFVNETWMWRKEDEAPLLLESRFGGWFHVAVSGWLVMKGVSAVTEMKEQVRRCTGQVSHPVRHQQGSQTPTTQRVQRCKPINPPTKRDSSPLALSAATLQH
ncbi:hypothetical protein F5144DRAFT_484841 [Chaetomium tenue]|uniref:Uncharacterized protein n=1 Tax=Chaetomium tenue TaxID=1854479 RepID=A0ACB7PHW1_9PEZI|nr:hypothetical protein F5144DRAFT_484841 [Chaetomium globosum]